VQGSWWTDPTIAPALDGLKYFRLSRGHGGLGFEKGQARRATAHYLALNAIRGHLRKWRYERPVTLCAGTPPGVCGPSFAGYRTLAVRRKLPAASAPCVRAGDEPSSRNQLIVASKLTPTAATAMPPVWLIHCALRRGQEVRFLGPCRAGDRARGVMLRRGADEYRAYHVTRCPDAG
jgi:hypothetical protein